MYAGGLGFLAGDHLKECSDLGVPLVAVGFMYSEGYLHQDIRPDGWQEGIQETLDRDAAPVKRVLNDDGGHSSCRCRILSPPSSLRCGGWMSARCRSTSSTRTFP